MVDLSSRLTKRVALEQPVKTPDGSGGYTTVWTNVASMWAEILPTKGLRHREEFISGQITEENSYKIIIRYRTDITHDMRFVLGSTNFNIRSIINPDQGQELLIINAQTGVAI